MSNCMAHTDDGVSRLDILWILVEDAVGLTLMTILLIVQLS